MFRAILCALAASVAACSSGAPSGGPMNTRSLGSVERLDPALDALIPKDAKMEILADGFDWTEGPVWVKDGGYLLFSDIPPNKVLKWKEGQGVTPYLHPSGYTGAIDRGGEPGSNGLILDPQGRLVLCQHGDRKVARMAAPLSKPAPRYETLADKYQGKRFNSPNDAVYHSSGALYFTDPPYGLLKLTEDPAKEIPFQGIYRLSTTGEVTLLDDRVTRPNGIAFSPDEKTLYVASSDPEKAIWMAYDVKADGTIANGRVFFDATKWVGKVKGLPDGLKIDHKGNLFATGPGGVLIFSPQGKHLGTLQTGEATSNCAWGEDGTVLYVTVDMYLVRIKTSTKGKGF
jgi:gluconolactonase